MKKVFVSTLCLLLVLTVSIIPLGLETQAAVSASYDFSREGSYYNTEITASDIIEMLGYEISAGERAYLDEYGPFKFKYERVTSQNVVTDRNESQVTVTADAYKYTSVSGDTVTWTPCTAEIDGKGTLNFEEHGGKYVVTFADIAPDDELEVKITFKMDRDIDISENDINDILNFAYNNKDSVKLEYNDALTQYESAKQAYDDFVNSNQALVDEYNEKLAEYDNYLNELKIYNYQNELYNQYKADLEQYNSDLAEYEAYLAKQAEYDEIKLQYDTYDTLYARYEKLKLAYDTYLAELKLANEQIEKFDKGLFDKITGLERQIYSSIMSGTVDSVLGMEKAFVDVGIPKQIFIDCGNATLHLREMLKTYEAIEGTKEKYTYYQTHYTDIKNYVVSLASCLEAFFTYPFIATAIGVEEKTEKYVIFISQLTLFANAISDEPIMSHAYSKNGSYVLDKNTVINYTLDGTDYSKTMLEILENDEYVTDTDNASPLSKGYPSEVKEPTQPAKPTVELPPLPAVVDEPALPKEVEEPTAPQTVEIPSRPAGMPEDPVKSDILSDEAVLSLLSVADELAEREAYSGSFTYCPTETVTKRIGNVDCAEVEFKSSKDDDAETLQKILVEVNSAVNFTEALPKKQSDVSADYRFDYWGTYDGTPYLLDNVTEDVVLYPHFVPVYKELTVDSDGYLTAGSEYEENTFVPLEHLLSVVDGTACTGLRIKFKGFNVILSKMAASALNISDVKSLEFDMDMSSDTLYTCRVSAFDGENAKVDTSVVMALEIVCTDTYFGEKTVLTTADADGNVKNAVKKYDSVNGVITVARFENGYDYVLKLPEKQISLKPIVLDEGAQALVNITIPQTATIGSDVKIDISDAPGVAVTCYYYSGGVKHIIENGTFKMLDTNVTVYVEAVRIEYTVIFESDGLILSQKQYYYGEMPEKPADPSKASTDEYTYIFKGWSSEVSAVTGDITYVAKFDVTEYVPPTIEEHWLVGLYEIAKICVIVLICILIAVAVLIVGLKHNKKFRKSRQETSEATAEQQGIEESAQAADTADSTGTADAAGTATSNDMTESAEQAGDEETLSSDNSLEEEDQAHEADGKAPTDDAENG